MKVKIKNRFTGSIIISGEYESVKDCLRKNKGADLGGAYLRGADLGGADLGGAKYYSESHDIFAEIIRRQKVSLFVQAEWCVIGQIVIHRMCWDTIKNRFSKEIPGIFQKLADAGFDEWLNRWNKITSGGKL